MNTSYLDIIFIVLLAGILLILSYLNYLDAAMKSPFVVIFMGYMAGRYVSYYLQKRSAKNPA